ncbi:hypothetical protein [uncultured Alsobacter sp.]|uniref:hypothetical protein n=1 Tax=uncultured Alsobacter sp. TaxID=1748258 RepID=UPI0025DB81F5|nr:hypothetical protein [uncultured Alsobacter sp.]
MVKTHTAFILACAAAAAILATPAAAQDRYGAQERDGIDRMHEMHMGGWDRGDRSWSGEDRRDWRSDNRRDRWSDRRANDDEDRDRGMAQRDGRRGGASFMLRSGDTRLAVRCSAQETMRACVEAATTLMDRARAAGATDGVARPNATTPPTTPP